MASVNISPNMLLPVPVVGVEIGPQWATDLNNCLNLVDIHDHSPGFGVQITPSGIDINSSLSFNNNNAIALKAVQFTPQGSTLPLVLGSLYEVGVDLYYTDGAGNVIRFTQSGSIAGATGTIAGLVSPASATYIPGDQTFVWQSNANTPANMDAASYIFRNLVSSSFGLTLEPPAAMSADYALVLPQLPPSVKIMTLDASGNMAAVLDIDNTTIIRTSNILSVAVDNIVDGVTLQSIADVISVRNGDREHNWELNGAYPGLSYPLTNIDAIFFAPYNITITEVWIYNGTAGASGTTEYDLLVASPGGGFTSILSTTGKITSAAASNIWTDSGSIVAPQTGVTKVVVSAPAVSAGQAIRFDLLQSMASPATDARIRIFYKQT